MSSFTREDRPRSPGYRTTLLGAALASVTLVPLAAAQTGGAGEAAPPTVGGTDHQTTAHNGARDRAVLHADNESGRESSGQLDFTPFGAGCPGTHGVPALSMVSGQPTRVGETIGVELSNLPELETAFLQIGTSKSLWRELPLPQDLGDIGMPGCALLASGEIVAPMFSHAGAVRWLAHVPGELALLGSRFFVQGFVIDERANRLGLVVTAGGEVRIGL